MKRLSVLMIVLAAGAALAHSNVKNPAVKARMDGMMQMGAATKVLGDMVKGKTAFDAAAAQAAIQTLHRRSAEVPALFEAQEDDPKSEALPTIWQDFTDFTAKAEALEKVTKAEVASLEDVRSVLPRIGAACKACHQTYRE